MPKQPLISFGTLFGRWFSNGIAFIALSFSLVLGVFLNDLKAESDYEELSDSDGKVDVPEEVFAELKKGMSFYEVVKLLGPPLEKKELEAKREDIWLYPEQKIFFHEGKVIAWTSIQSVKVDLIDGWNSGSENTSETSAIIVSPREKKTDPLAVEKILDELIEQSSEEGSSPSAAPGMINPPPGARMPDMDMPRPPLDGKR